MSSRWFRYLLVGAGVVGGFLLGYFLLQRFVWLNVHAVVPGEIYRSAQPTAALLERMQREEGLKSVLKLNSDNDSAPSRAEEPVLRRLGLNYLHVSLAMTRLPTRAQLLEILEILESAPRPLLVHCNAGADRTGLVSTLAAMANGQTLQEARAAQLTPLYLHVGLPGEDVVEVLDQFEAERALSRKPAVTFADFVDYVTHDYFPTFYHARLQVLDHSDQGARVAVSNASRWFFARGEDDHYELVAYHRNADGTRTVLDRQAVPPLDPGATVERTLRYTRAPDGDRAVELDLLQVGKTWFSERGSPVVRIGVEAQAGVGAG